MLQQYELYHMLTIFRTHLVVDCHATYASHWQQKGAGLCYVVQNNHGLSLNTPQSELCVYKCMQKLKLFLQKQTLPFKTSMFCILNGNGTKAHLFISFNLIENSLVVLHTPVSQVMKNRTKKKRKLLSPPDVQYNGNDLSAEKVVESVMKCHSKSVLYAPKNAYANLSWSQSTADCPSFENQLCMHSSLHFCWPNLDGAGFE